MKVDSPFLKLDEESQTFIAEALMKEYDTTNVCSDEAFGEAYAQALSLIDGEEVEHTVPLASRIVEDLTSRAKNRIDTLEGIEKFKKMAGVIPDLTRFLQIGSRAFFVAGAAGASLALLYYRSQKVLAVASGATACALIVLGLTSLKIKASFEWMKGVIENLQIENYDQFPQNIDLVYAGLRKTICLTPFYFFARSDRSGPELLKEQLSAFGNFRGVLKDIGLNILGSEKTIPSLSKSLPVDVDLFFAQLAGVAQKGGLVACGAGLVSAGFSYYAFRERAYLMVIAGAIQCVGFIAMSAECWTIRNGSRKMSAKAEDALNNLVARSMLFRAMGLKGASKDVIIKAVVIPFNQILKLIPGWKSVL